MAPALIGAALSGATSDRNSIGGLMT